MHIKIQNKVHSYADCQTPIRSGLEMVDVCKSVLMYSSYSNTVSLQCS